MNKYFMVSGHVQGVFFRRYTQKMARHLQLTGWVKNTSDGRVELLACGEEAHLQFLEKALWQGPPAAKVENVLVQDKETLTETFSDFEIR